MSIEVQVPATERAAYIDFQIPMWQPGRYSVADFAKNVQEFNARSGNTQLSWMKIDDQTWRVQRGMNRTITASYRMFGNDLSGTYAQLDVGHAKLHRWRALHVHRRAQAGSGAASYRAATELERHQRAHGTAESGRVAISQLRNHDRQSDGDRSGLDGG